MLIIWFNSKGSKYGLSPFKQLTEPIRLFIYPSISSLINPNLIFLRTLKTQNLGFQITCLDKTVNRLNLKEERSTRGLSLEKKHNNMSLTWQKSSVLTGLAIFRFIFFLHLQLYKKSYKNILYFHHINVCIKNIYSSLIHVSYIFSLINTYVKDIYLSLIVS